MDLTVSSGSDSSFPSTDGFQVDWEHPSDPEQGRNFLALLAAIRLHLPDDHYLLTAALPAGRWALQNIDLYRAQDYLDLINLMAYDFRGSWSAKAGHHAQLHPANPDEPSGSAAVDYVLSTGFAAAKILLGIPAYGRSFLGAAGPGHAYSGHGGEDETFEYKQLPRQGTEEIVDTRVVAAFCTGGDGGFVTYDNPETVKIKANYCREKGLGVSFRNLNAIETDHLGVVLLDWHSGRRSGSAELGFGRLQSFARLLKIQQLCYTRKGYV
jgi:chitinase